MLIIDRIQRTWAALSIAICAVAGGVYVVYSTSSLNGPSGGSLPGLIFGIISAGMMIFAGLLAARRRVPAARLGSAQFWLRGHLWIGALTVPFALFHAGFGWGGRLEWLLWGLFLAVILSGFWGLALQQILPRLMLEQIPRETFIEQIPHLCLRFSAESDRSLADVCGPLEVSLLPGELKQLQPYLLPDFEEDRKKNRNDYPKTASEVDQFQIFLVKVYANVKSPLAKDMPESTVKSTCAVVQPVVKSVARSTPPAIPTTTASEPLAVATISPDTEPPSPSPVLDSSTVVVASPVASVPSTDVPVASSKPDPRAMLAAAKAKKAAAGIEQPAAVATSAIDRSPVESAPTPVAALVVASKPDPRAMLAAMKAKKDAAAVEGGIPTAVPAAAQPVSPVQSAEMKEPSVEGQNILAAVAVKAAPPSPAQVAELKQIYLELIRPQLPLQPITRRWMEAIRRATLACHIRQEALHPQFVPIFNRLHDICEQRRQFAFVQRYHRWLHGWLLVHIPATVALYVMLLVHAVSALRVIPFGN